MVSKSWPLIMVLLAGVTTGGCTSPAYVKYVKPVTDQIRVHVKKVGDLSDKYRDPPCEVDCEWQRDAFDRE